MPLISGLRKLICTLNDEARTISCMSEETEVLVADGVPRPRLVLVGLGLVAVDPLHVGAGPTEVNTVVAEVDRRVDTARDDRTLGRRDEVLAGQVAARVLQQRPQRLRQPP